MGMVCYGKKPERKNKKSLINEKIDINFKEKEQIKNHKKEKKEQKIIEKENFDKKLGIKQIYVNLLKQHNDIRKNYKCENLNLNDDLTILAQKFADNFDILKQSNFLNDNYYQPLGINYEIFKGDISKLIDICQNWINEEEYFVNNTINDDIKYFSKTKHFTQIIWKKTKEIGIGFSTLNNNDKIFIIVYFPAGNIFDEFKNNISLKNKEQPKKNQHNNIK